MSRASDLYRLQEIDLEADRLNGRLEEITSTLQDSSELEALNSELTSRQSVLDGSQSSARGAQHEVEDQRLKIDRTDEALYGGSVQNPKELEDLQMESESLRRYLETIEDRYLEAMLEQDEAAAAVAETQEAIERLETELRAVHSDLLEEREKIQSRLPDLAAQRAAILPGISEEDQQSYLRLRGKFRGVAVSILDGQTCGICGLTLSASDQQTVRSGDELVRCNLCGRILYGG